MAPIFLLLLLALVLVSGKKSTGKKTNSQSEAATVPVPTLFEALQTAGKSTPALEEAIAAHRSEIDTPGEGGQTPLMRSVLGGHTEAVGSLLRAGADTSIGEENHYTPLHGAGFQGRAPALKLLLAHGLNPLDMHQDGFLPLHRACWGMEKKHTDTVRVFLKAGVDPKSPALNGKNCAQMSKNQGTLDLLRSYSDDDDVDTAAELR
mmetsp:Transcript_171/g.342  ORF Transcript_171/g.342 Transcript_171/m.342 type:complete len:206 (+) Transcript_171:154-771(+)|eukprot:CAMPEP_0173198692 /NCGR_PEP_ID=MMETSP1141-20130122/16821_1 /TAXON_ID=483371 /ORGANISM="non described non described, Strain CCMP2298" /LENGTH=205 /DNA_ID=CAMNT_0014123499 /DNA_START=74 /DNA_END=691 /DNA_ORIENTATION=-